MTTTAKRKSDATTTAEYAVKATSVATVTGAKFADTDVGIDIAATGSNTDVTTVAAKVTAGAPAVSAKCTSDATTDAEYAGKAAGLHVASDESAVTGVKLFGAVTRTEFKSAVGEYW